MQEENGRFLQTIGAPITFSENRLSIGRRVLVQKHLDHFVPCMTDTLQGGSGQHISNIPPNPQLLKIAELLNDGRQFEAILIASTANWDTFGDYTSNGEITEKANFNPQQLRDDRGAWTREGQQSTSSSTAVPVQYRGYFHDFVVDDIVSGLEKTGSIALKNVHVFGLNGILAIPDAVSLPKGQVIPYFIEVKTGFDPKFTANQEKVYPLICIGGHAISLDPRIAKLGLVPGVPFPPLDIMLVHTYGPGLPLRIENYCEMIGLRSPTHGP